MCSCSCSLNQPIEARKSFLYVQLTQATYDCEVGLSLVHEKCGLAVSVLVILGVQLHSWTCNVGKFSARETRLRGKTNKVSHTHTHTCARKQVGRMDENETFRSTSQLHVHFDRSPVTLEVWGILTFRSLPRFGIHFQRVTMVFQRGSSHCCCHSNFAFCGDDH